jgi:adenosylhomocysteine nucleosidase
MKSKTGIIIATKIEANPFIEGLGLKTIEKKPFAIWGDGAFILVVSGIGKTNAAVATTHLIEACGARQIINCGAAGAAGRGFKIGDILHINRVVEPDRPRIPFGGPMSQKPNIIKGFPTASLATRDRPVINEADRLAASSCADLVDMEGAAVVQACRLLSRKVYLFKIVTDTAGHGTVDIIRNMLLNREKLFIFMKDRVLSSSAAD